jgi:hypothetical protein
MFLKTIISFFRYDRYPYDAFHDFPGNSIKPRDERYRRYIPVSIISRTGYAKLQVGEAHSSARHPQPLHTHADGIYIVVGATEHRHPLPPEPSDPLLSLYLSCPGVIEFPGKL